MVFTKEKSLSKILSVFETVKTELVEFIGQEIDNVNVKTNEAARLTSEVDAHNTNIYRANAVLNNPDDFDEIRRQVESEKKAEVVKVKNMMCRLAKLLHRGVTPLSPDSNECFPSTPEQVRDNLKAIPTSEPQTFVPEVTRENIVVGDKLTVEKWVSYRDTSYKGDFLTVKYLALPFVFVERGNRYNPSIKDALQLSMDDVVFQRLSPAFVEGFEWMSKASRKAS